jgi:CHAT domain-containing protein
MRRAILIPHEMLWRVPFEALPSGNGWLMDRVEVVYAASLEALRRGSRANAPADALLAVGAPQLAESLTSRLKSTAPGWVLRPVDASSREIERIAAAHGVASTPMVLSGAIATEPAWRAQAPSARVLQISAPFRVNGASPLFSPILLSGDPGSRDAAHDGAVEMREVANLELRASVAVLSDGGALAMRDGAGALPAVQWTWLASGVPALLVCRWASESGEELLAAFHQHLADGAPPADALRRAREDLRARPQTSAPAHWAGWVLLTGTTED